MVGGLDAQRIGHGGNIAIRVILVWWCPAGDNFIHRIDLWIAHVELARILTVLEQNFADCPNAPFGTGELTKVRVSPIGWQLEPLPIVTPANIAGIVP